MPGAGARTCAYLGPRGTFCEQAVSVLHADDGFEAMAYPSIEATLDAVRSGQAGRAVVPIESSVEGGVNATLDELASGPVLLITAEVVVGVEFALLARPGTALEDVATVGGHPVAQPQCRQWLAKHLPEARWLPALSNADAARQVAEGEIDAALAGSFAARHYRLAVLADSVHDNATAVTRFVEVRLPGVLSPATGRDRTSVIAYLTDDHPGALMDILSQFAVRDVNLTRIESRPTGEGIGRYCFFIDCEGHVTTPKVGEALMGLRRTCSSVRFLGSYRRADLDGTGPDGPGPVDSDGNQIGDAVADARFTDAAAWLERIRSGLSET